MHALLQKPKEQRKDACDVYAVPGYEARVIETDIHNTKDEGRRPRALI
jgi:hypothetical protein